MTHPDKRLLDELCKDICAALWTAGRSDYSEVQDAHKSGDITLLRLLQSFIPDESVSLSSVRNLYSFHRLSPSGAGAVENFVTAERLAYFHEMQTKFMDWKDAGLMISGADVMDFLLKVEVGDRELAERIVRGRWPGSVEQAWGLLNEMKHSTQPLVEGIL